MVEHKSSQFNLVCPCCGNHSNFDEGYIHGHHEVKFKSKEKSKFLEKMTVFGGNKLRAYMCKKCDFLILKVDQK